jgi:hypothetical protein
MDVLQDILSEQDILSLKDDSMEALVRLLDDMLAKRFMEYYNNPDANPEVKQRIQEKLMPTIERILFSQSVIERGLADFISKISLDSLYIEHINRDKMIEDLEWLQQHKDKLKATLEPRRLMDFKMFIDGLDGKAYLRVKANKDMFYTQRERVRGTGVRKIIEMTSVWEMALLGLKYRAYVESNGIHENYWGKEF